VNDKSRIFTETELRNIVSEGVEQAFTRLGIEADSPIEMQKDFQHLREWRESIELVKQRSLIAALGVVLAGVGTVLWLGIKTYLQQH